jgi:hypothetical protein
MKVHGPWPDLAPPGDGDLRLAESVEKGTHKENGDAIDAGVIEGNLEGGEGGIFNFQDPGLGPGILRAQEFAHLQGDLDVPDPGNIAQAAFSLGEKGGNYLLSGGVLGPGYFYNALKFFPAGYLIFFYTFGLRIHFSQFKKRYWTQITQKIRIYTDF